MPARGLTFDAVRAIGRTLPDVEEVTSWGVPALKVRGTMFVCMAANKQAEPNTLVVRMDFDQRDALLAEDPDTYYLKEHYVSYPCVLVRLSRVRRDALHDLVSGACRWIGAQTKKRAPKRAAAVSASSRASRSRTRRSRG